MDTHNFPICILLTYIIYISKMISVSSFSDERESVQKKTFQKWVNSHLVRVGCRISDLYVDMRDGKMLIKLLEVLSGERLVSHHASRVISHYHASGKPTVAMAT